MVVLGGENIEARRIRAVTGHRSDASIDSYNNRPSLKQFRKCPTFSRRLSPKTKTAQLENLQPQHSSSDIATARSKSSSDIRRYSARFRRIIVKYQAQPAHVNTTVNLDVIEKPVEYKKLL